MAEIESGIDLYTVNKQLMLKRSPIGEEMLKREFSGICDWFSYEKSKYFMLLCHERRDYTIIHFINRSKRTHEACVELKEILDNRGEILDIEYEDQNAYAIWLKIDDDAHLYYLFPYDWGVIEI